MKSCREAFFILLLAGCSLGYALGAAAEVFDAKPSIAEIERYALRVPPGGPETPPPGWPLTRPAQTGPAFTHAIRGGRDAMLHTGSNRVSITLIKQDLNWEAGAEPLFFQLIDSRGDIVFHDSLPDDGDDSASYRAGPIVERTFEIPLARPGDYRLSINSGRDQLYEVRGGAPRLAWPLPLELYAPGRPLDLFFYAPRGAFEIQAYTWHDAGLGKTLRLFDADGVERASARLDRTGTSVSLLAIPRADEAGSVWRLNIPYQDLIIQSNDVDYCSTDESLLYDFASSDDLLLPAQLTMTGAPGMRVPFRFRIENRQFQPRRFSIRAVRDGGAAMTISPASSEIAVDAGETAYLPVSVNTQAGAAPGERGEFSVTLFDEFGGEIARATGTLKLSEYNYDRPEPELVLFDDARLETIRERGRNGAAAMRSIYNAALSYADRIVSDAFAVPDREAGWTGMYIADGLGDGDDDPNDGTGAPLIFNPYRPGYYIDSTSGERYFGDRYERGWLGYFHSELSNRLRVLGYAYALEPKPEYARAARDMLVAYAERYSAWPLDDYLGRQSIQAARLTTETLGEAIWMHRAAPAYALTRGDPAYSDDDRLLIEENLFRPAAEIIQRNPMGAYNWQSWHDAAVGLIGYVLNDDALVEWALRGPNGLNYLKANGIRDDGLWFEGSVGYHFFALLPLHLLMEAAEAHGEHEYDERIRLAHSSILDLAYPNGRFPDLNDSTSQTLISRDVLYESANAHYDDPAFDRALTLIYETLGYPRSDLETLFFGEDYQSAPFELHPVLKPKMGLAILDAGSTLHALDLLMDYGPHGMAHGHLDKLHVSFFSFGDAWLPDIGSVVSSQPTWQGWFRQTLGHNTVVVGETKQGEDTEEEREIGFFSGEPGLLQAMQASFGSPVYPAGASVRRTVLLAGGEYAVILDDVTGAPAPIDFVFHSIGAFAFQQPFTPWPGAAAWSDRESYQWLRPPRVWNAEGASVADGVLSHESAEPFFIDASERFGFSDDCERLEPWSGNVGLATDAFQGERSLGWVVVPTDYQSIGKEFFLLTSNAPERLAFRYKVESASFERFSVSINDAHAKRRSIFTIAQGADATPGEWRAADLDLARPNGSADDPLAINRLDFVLTGADGFSGSFKIMIDDIRAYRGGAYAPGEVRGVRFAFPGREPTRTILASGPSQALPRSHPVLISRREGVASTRHVTLVEPYLIEPRMTSAEWIGDGVLQIDSLMHDRLTIDPDRNQYTFVRRISSGRLRGFVSLGSPEWKEDDLWFRFGAPAKFTAYQGSLDWRLRYLCDAPGGEITLAIPEFAHFIEATLDGQPFYDWRMDFRGDETAPAFVFTNLPAGDHEILVFPAASTRVNDWRRR
ncbi:MAG: hypothetical protein GC154_11440 [bacterium]|nr:hypothetical protein [bacterium]